MGLVDYSDSESDEEPKLKKAKTSKDTSNALPPLPAGFRDLYSSTVRTSTQDDPSLHGGKKRVTPHVVGNWPTHLYLDWCPKPAEYRLLSETLAEVKKAHGFRIDISSLLDNELGVQLPLHVSLSRPLALKTEQKDRFLAQLKDVVGTSGIHAFDVKPMDLIWHPNEDRTRWFLVLRLKRPQGDELRKILRICNETARAFDQPLLYQELVEIESDGPGSEHHDSFHVSIASSLKASRMESNDTVAMPEAVFASSWRRLEALRVAFSELKVRIGQDVSNISLPRRRVV